MLPAERLMPRFPNRLMSKTPETAIMATVPVLKNSSLRCCMAPNSCQGQIRMAIHHQATTQVSSAGGSALTERGGKEEGRESKAGAEPPDFSSSAQAPSCSKPFTALYRRSSNCSKPSGPARSPCSSSLHTSAVGICDIAHQSRHASRIFAEKSGAATPIQPHAIYNPSHWQRPTWHAGK